MAVASHTPILARPLAPACIRAAPSEGRARATLARTTSHAGSWGGGDPPLALSHCAKSGAGLDFTIWDGTPIPTAATPGRAGGDAGERSTSSEPCLVLTRHRGSGQPDRRAR